MPEPFTADEHDLLADDVYRRIIRKAREHAADIAPVPGPFGIST